MSFLPRTLYLDQNEMVNFILTIPKNGWLWSPKGITWHNTAAPSIAQWNAYSEPQRQAWGDNYDHYVKFDLHWHSGPHFCATPDKSFVLCEPRANGVHASCFNSDHYGVETVGDFRPGGDDPHVGRGLLSMLASANIIAALCKRMNWSPQKVINFHRDCIRDHHPCPGALVTNEWAIGLVENRLAALNSSSIPPTDPFNLATVEGLQRALNALGANPQLAIDGDNGPLTANAVKTYQRSHDLVPDGIAGSATIVVIEREIGRLS